MIDNNFLEDFYVNVILSRYSDSLDINNVRWIDHGRVDLDSFAHTFMIGDTEYVLLYEDNPGITYVGDGLSHELVKCGNETSIELKFSDNYQMIENITGWFALYREKKR